MTTKKTAPKKPAPKKPAPKQQLIVPGPAELVRGGLDQAMPFPNLATYLDQIVETVTSPKATLRDNVELLGKLNAMGKLAAVGNAAVLWYTRDRWEKLSGKKFDTIAGRDADFQEFVFHEVGYMPDTTRRYCLAMDFLNEAKVNLGPKSDVWEALLQRDIKDLIGLGQYTTEHGLLSKKQLGEVAQEPDNNSLRKKLNEYKGKEPANRGLALVLDDNGTITAWVNDHPEIVGSMLAEEDLNEQGRRGRAALIRRAKLEVR